MSLHTSITTWFAKNEEELINLADYIFQHPETLYKEHLSSKALGSFLSAQGFQVEYHLANLETAFLASFGSGSPCLGFLAEYDALEGLGHACGHNLLGVGSAAAACALKEYMEAEQIEGTILVYGCPAEENMSGKITMNQAGVFAPLDVAITWHPFDQNRISNDIWLAQDYKKYHFHGRSSHAARFPELGRSALDAAELMNVGVNYLREHVSDDVRMHYAYTNACAPANVVPDYVESTYFIRSAKRHRTDDASLRVDNCAKGAALMTGTTVEIERVASCMEMKVNRILCETFYRAMAAIETPSYTTEELAFAKDLTKEFQLKNNKTYFAGLMPLEDAPLILPLGTDVSDVSHTVPTITISAATMCKGTPLHHESTTRQSGMSIGHKGMLYAAKTMCLGATYLLEDTDLIPRIWKEHEEKESMNG